MQKFKIDNLTIEIAGSSADRICYLLFPIEMPDEMIEQVANHLGVTMVMVYGMDWDNDLTPWPAPGEPPGCPDFLGNAPQFLDLLQRRVLPEVERCAGISAGAERTLAGVSLSGLFALWQWLVIDTFDNIISLSGSFWYDGFASWVTSHPVPRKPGRAYFSLGDRESDTKVKAFRSVHIDTVEIVDYLRAVGIDVFFEMVPGNHYQDGPGRLARALRYMYLPTQN